MKNQKGFTLVELLVAITIVAILGVVGFTLFSGMQGQARDSVRRSEIDSIAKSLEANYVATATTGSPIVCKNSGSPGVSRTTPSYCPLQVEWFQKRVVPTDPSGGTYCIQTNNDANDSGYITDLTTTTWTLANRGTCPTGWAAPADDAPAAAFRNFKVCAHMEAQDSVFCIGNQQR